MENNEQLQLDDQQHPGPDAPATERGREVPGDPAEVRTLSTGLEYRAAQDPDESPGTLEGYAFLWDVPTRLSNFSEVVERSAMDGVLERSDIRALLNHDPNHVLGRYPDTLQLDMDEKGLRYTVQLPNTQTGRDLATLAKRGDINQSSYAFRVDAEGQRWDDETRTRHITQFLDVLDVSPVTYPAQPATSATVRTSFVPPVADEPQQPAAGPSEAQQATETTPEVVEVQREQENPAKGPKMAEANNSQNFTPYIMQNSNDLKAIRSHKLEELKGLTAGAQAEGRAVTEQDTERIDALNDQIADLDAKIERQEKTEANLRRMASMSAGAASSSEQREQDTVSQRYSISKAINEAVHTRGGLTGLEAEMAQQAAADLRAAGKPAEGVLQVPGFINQRATSTTSGTNLPGASSTPLLEGLTPNPVIQQMGANVLTGLAGDIILPTLGNDYTDTDAETDAVSSGSAISARKLVANRIASRIDVSNALIAQMNGSVDATIGSQFARATAAKVDRLFIADLIATSTFQLRQDTAAATVPGLDAATAAKLHANVGDAGSPMTRGGFLSSHGVLAYAKHTATVSGGGIPVMTNGQVLGFQAMGTGECAAALITDTAYDTAAEVFAVPGAVTNLDNEASLVPIIFADFADVYLAYWGAGATDLVIDPYTSAASGITRLIVNAYADAKIAHAGAGSWTVGA